MATAAAIAQRDVPGEPPRPALAELFAQNVHLVWRVLERHGVPRSDVEDATQEVFLIAHRRLEDWDPARAAASTWLYAIAVRVAANWRRKVARPLGQLDPRTPTDPGTKLDRHRAMAKVRAVLDAMEPGRREVFVMFELEAISMKQVAEMVGCPLQTAYTRLHAARREVALALGEGHQP